MSEHPLGWFKHCIVLFVYLHLFSILALFSEFGSDRIRVWSFSYSRLCLLLLGFNMDLMIRIEAQAKCIILLFLLKCY